MLCCTAPHHPPAHPSPRLPQYPPHTITITININININVNIIKQTKETKQPNQIRPTLPPSAPPPTPPRHRPPHPRPQSWSKRNPNLQRTPQQRRAPATDPPPDAPNNNRCPESLENPLLEEEAAQKTVLFVDLALRGPRKPQLDDPPGVCLGGTGPTASEDLGRGVGLGGSGRASSGIPLLNKRRALGFPDAWRFPQLACAGKARLVEPSSPGARAEGHWAESCTGPPDCVGAADRDRRPIGWPRAAPESSKSAASTRFARDTHMFARIRALSADGGAKFRATMLPPFRKLPDDPPPPRPSSGVRPKKRSPNTPLNTRGNATTHPIKL